MIVSGVVSLRFRAQATVRNPDLHMYKCMYVCTNMHFLDTGMLPVVVYLSIYTEKDRQRERERESAIERERESVCMCVCIHI